jgi:hypothetical protein
MTRKDYIGTVISCAYNEDPYRPGYNQFDCNVATAEISNCLFMNNVQTMGSQWDWMADVSFQKTPDVEVNIVNNTFYNTCALAIPDMFRPVRIINNAFYNDPDKVPDIAGRSTNHIIITWPSTAEGRAPFIGYNNVFVGASDLRLDEDCFGANASFFGNQMFKNKSDLAKLGLADAASTDKLVPYLPIVDAQSILIDKGRESLVVNSVELIPAQDMLGMLVNNKKDIGSFEYEGLATGIGKLAVNNSLFTVKRSGEGVVIRNNGTEALSIQLFAIDGRTLHATTVVSETTIEQYKGIVIITGHNGKEVATQKVIL